MADRTRPDPTDPAPDAVRAFITGTVVGVVLVGGFCGGITYLTGFGLAGGLAVGAFCAFWGGPGFGGMMGFVVHRSRRDRDLRTAARSPIAAGAAGPVSSTSG